MCANPRSLAFSIVLVLALALAPATGAAALGAPAPDTAAPGGGGGAASLQQAQGDCDYERLFNETVESLALIRTGSGLGSGFVYRVAEGNGTGYVVTNQHVVADNDQVLVKFSRGETVSGQVVGTSALADLAVVRVGEVPDYVSSLPVSDSLPNPGERVAALGSPYGLERTITSGIVSGVGRAVPTQGDYALPTTVQTDAPINPGNSGGPLVACATGEVVGVNRAGGSENIGFAVSSAIVRQVVPELIRTGDYDFAMLGVGAVEVSEPVAQVNDLNTTQGVLVTGTIEGTPASEVLQASPRVERVSGVRVPVGGDVIVGIGNRSVETPSDLSRYIALEGEPGETVQLTILRDGERRTVNVTLVERPEPTSA